MTKRALISVSNKEGVIDFAKGLVELGFEIVSTGGTSKALSDAGVPVTYITKVTDFPEILDGRVKTLHPNIHGGILARRTQSHLMQLKKHNITPIDLVAVNLYPFKETIAKEDVSLEEAIENIDIGGPTMVRSAAKNHESVLIVVNPNRYLEILDALKENKVTPQMRISLALEAFSHTASYDGAISTYLNNIVNPGEFPKTLLETYSLDKKLRYGENPHQSAAFYRQEMLKGACVANAKQLSGKELSFNNILDLNAAFELVREFTEKPAVVIVKHNNPCGVGLADDILGAYDLALESDPVSAFGGIVACNREVTKDAAQKMTKLFLEAIIAPSFEEEALEILKVKENLRLLQTGEIDFSNDFMDVRKVNGGLLIQDRDLKLFEPEDLNVVSEKKPNLMQLEDMLYAMLIAKHVKSNAIVLFKNNQLIGVGAGQMNRVGAAKIALEEAGEKAKGAVLASDAYFPFRDTVDLAAQYGVSALIQPGGSMRDQESLDAVNEHEMIMVYTGMRHFKH